MTLSKPDVGTSKELVPLNNLTRKPGGQPYGIFTTPGAMWYGVKMCGKAYGVRSCYDGRGMCTTLPENLDHVVLLLFFVN